MWLGLRNERGNINFKKDATYKNKNIVNR